MPYTAFTLGQLLADLAERLQDPANVFWTAAELTLYVQEALQTWNSMAAWYRDRMVFNTAAATPWYDLSAVPGTLIPYAVTDSTLFNLIEYHLLEPPGNVYTGSEMFTGADITNNMQKRRDQFLLETGTVITRSIQTGAQTVDGRVQLSNAIIDVRRAVYLDGAGLRILLWPGSESEANSYQFGWWTAPGPPSVFTVVETPPIVIQIIPIPILAGVLEILSVNSGAALNPAVGVPLGIPNDFSWVVKWGTLADLLTRDGQASDPTRAKYCQQRWIEGIRLAKISTTAITGAIDGNNCPVNSVFDMDTSTSGWENNPVTTPSVLGLAGMNMLAVADPPDSFPHSIQLDVLRNMPLPAVAGDFIQVGAEELDVILDYSEHLACFKMGGAEFLATMPAYERMVALARKQNERWRAFSRFPEDEHDRGRREEQQRRRQEHPEDIPMAADMVGGI
jgi:hypothetical protein